MNQGQKILATAVIVILATSSVVLGGLWTTGLIPSWSLRGLIGPVSTTPNCNWTTQHWDPSAGQCVANTPLPTGQGGPAPLIVGETDALGGPLTTAYQGAVEVISADRASQLDNITIKTTFNVGTTPLVPGTEVYLHAYYKPSSYVYVDEWFHTTIGQNAIVTHLVPNQNGAPTEQNFGTMTWYSTGSAVGWMITPAFPLYADDEQVSGGLVTVQISGPGSTTYGTANFTKAEGGGANIDKVKTADVNFTASSTSFSFKVTLSNTLIATTTGHPYVTVGPNLEWQSRFMVAWVSFNTTAIAPDPLINQGWTPVGSAGQATGYASYYQVLPEIDGTRTQAGEGTFNINVDTSLMNSGVGVSVRVWVATGQILSTVKAGLATSAPSGTIPLYGGVTKYGMKTTGFSYALTSGVPTNQIVYAVFKSK